MPPTPAGGTSLALENAPAGARRCGRQRAGVGSEACAVMQEPGMGEVGLTLASAGKGFGHGKGAAAGRPG